MELQRNKTSEISIIVPTYGREDLVKLLLISLNSARSTFDGKSEVIIVDSSHDEQQARIKQYCKNFDAKYHHMENNVRFKRNWGVRQAQYSILLFIDSDCQASKQLLVEHARIYNHDHSSKLGGVVGLTQFIGKENWVWQVIKRASTLDFIFIC
jgi:glycosyltransferase involved in cell wall biosynthesis